MRLPRLEGSGILVSESLLKPEETPQQKDLLDNIFSVIYIEEGGMEL